MTRFLSRALLAAAAVLLFAGAARASDVRYVLETPGVT